MRLPLIPPADFSLEQKAFFDEMVDLTTGNLQGFTTTRADGAMAGPFNVYLHTMAFAKTFWDFNRALIDNGVLPKNAREVAILTTGAHFTSRFEIYAHEGVAQDVGLSAAKVATITAGQRPTDLTDEEAITYDVTSALVTGNQIHAVTYDRAIDILGEEGFSNLLYLVGCYCTVSILLNGYDESVPGTEHGL